MTDSDPICILKQNQLISGHTGVTEVRLQAFISKSMFLWLKVTYVYAHWIHLSGRELEEMFLFTEQHFTKYYNCFSYFADAISILLSFLLHIILKELHEENNLITMKKLSVINVIHALINLPVESSIPHQLLEHQILPLHL